MKTGWIEDLSPFFAERCRLFVLMAEKERVAVILRRGPTNWCRVSLWDTRLDTIQPGQWFHGRLYPERCDISPDGKLLVYFGGKFRARDWDTGYLGTWTAVSRPPYLTALALWPNGSTYGGGGVFLDDRTLWIHEGGSTHPDHPHGPLSVVRTADPALVTGPGWRRGWSGILAPGATTRMIAWIKPVGRLILERQVDSHYDPYPYRGKQRSLFTLLHNNGKVIAMFEADWADCDQRERLVATAGGRVLVGEVKRKLRWRQIADVHEERCESIVAPAWAQEWRYWGRRRSVIGDHR